MTPICGLTGTYFVRWGLFYNNVGISDELQHLVVRLVNIELEEAVMA
jgi:hypothetical protein